LSLNNVRDEIMNILGISALMLNLVMGLLKHDSQKRFRSAQEVLNMLEKIETLYCEMDIRHQNKNIALNIAPIKTELENIENINAIMIKQDNPDSFWNRDLFSVHGKDLVWAGSVLMIIILALYWLL